MKTNEMKHTPGPWVSHGHYGIIQIESETRDICDVDVCDDEDKANALIIAAAPELLEALIAQAEADEAAEKYMTRKWDQGGERYADFDEARTELWRDMKAKQKRAIAMRDAAIARATTPTTEGGL